MKYLALIHRNAGIEPDGDLYQAYESLAKELAEKGTLLGGNPVQPPSKGVCVQVVDGEVVSTPGAFGDSPHSLVGYFLLECETDEEAQATAARIPDAATGTIEVRPILEH